MTFVREAFTEVTFRRLLVVLGHRHDIGPLVGTAVGAARRDHAALTLMVVTADWVVDASRWSTWVCGGPDTSQLQRDADEYAEELLRDAVSQIPSDIPVTTVVRRGNTHHEIVAQARASNSDAVLLGSSTARGWRWRSIAAHVARHSEIAVMTSYGQTMRRASPTSRRIWPARADEDRTV